MKLGRTQKCDCVKYFQFSPILFTLLLPVVIAKTLVDTCYCHPVSRVQEMLFLTHNLEPCQADAAAWPFAIDTTTPKTIHYDNVESTEGM